MKFRDWLEDRMDDFLAPSACLFVETVMKCLPKFACVFRDGMTVTMNNSEEIRAYIPPGEPFTVLGHVNELGKERRIIALTSLGVVHFKVLSGRGEGGLL